MLEVAQPRGSEEMLHTKVPASSRSLCVYSEPEHSRFGIWRFIDDLLCHLTS